MVIASHVIFTTYGFWLPNDPRGSWSEFVGAWDLFVAGGKATKVETRRSVARKPHDRAARLAVKTHLKYPEVKFSGEQAQTVGHAIRDFVNDNGLRVWACSILPQHVHMVIARHHYDVEQAVTLLKGAATSKLVERGIHPLARFPTKTGRPPKCFARGEWKVYLDDVADVRRAIPYVERNPEKEGLRRQHWSFVTKYEP